MWADHPCRPVEARPDEADRQTREYAKDLPHTALPVRVRDDMGRIELSLEVRFLALCRQPGLDCRIRQDTFYVAGRAAMALDLPAATSVAVMGSSAAISSSSSAGERAS